MNVFKEVIYGKTRFRALTYLLLTPLLLNTMVLSNVTHAGVATDKLKRFYNDVQSMSASFSQVTMDTRFNNPSESTGRLVMQRPGKFRWDYKSPYEQLIVANGKNVWVYDKDLEQVTVNKLDAVIGNTPALLLSGDESLERKFNIVELKSSNGLDWVELIPRDADTSFTSVRLAFGKTKLAVMELEDSFGQTTQLRFTDITNNPEINADFFNFRPPKGVDVIGEGQ
jgi:outer membrane lipoprotein carrier protein